MNEPRSIFGEYSELLKEWCVAAFCSATLDWVASKIPVRNGIFATLLSIGQITFAFYAVNATMGFFSSKGGLLHITDNWLAYNTIILMSPTAINRLTSSYQKLHFILYGPGRIPQAPSCASGNCGTSNIAGADQRVEPQRELADSLAPKAQERNMSERIASQWKSMKASNAVQK